MSNIAATLSLNVPAITALCKGNRGTIIYVSAGTPSNTYGLSADLYIDSNTGLFYGPKINDSLWPTSPIFALNLPVSSYPLILVPGTTSLIIPSYTGNNLVGNYSAILGGINNTLTGDNSFILGSNITAAITGYTLVNNLSATGTIFASAGDSNLWYSAYINTSSNSARWTSAYTNLTANSANWRSTYTSMSANSANWQSTYTSMSANSANWLQAANIINALSYVTYTYNAAASSIIPAHGTNFATGSASNVGGGNTNTASGYYSSVLGGVYNTAAGNYSNVTGGFSGQATATYSNIAGGICNTASGYGSSVGGGIGNLTCGYGAAIAAGAYNVSSCCSTFIGGGRYNTASGLRTAIVGGLCNTASGNYSFVAAGTANDTKGFVNTFILGSSLSASQANFTYVNNISAQNNISSSTINTYSLSVSSINPAGGAVGIGTSVPSQTLEVNGNILGANEIISTIGTGYGQFRAIDGVALYGFMIRNDSTNSYFLLTNSGAPYGTWNGLRPLTINNASGNVGIGGAPTPSGATLQVQGNVTASGTISIGSSARVATTNYTVSDSDCGGIVYMNSTSPLSVTIAGVTVRNGFQVSIIRAGTGTVTFTGGTINQAYGLVTLSSQWSAATLTWNSTFGWVLFGDLA